MQWPAPIFSKNLANFGGKQLFALLNVLGPILMISSGREVPSLVLTERLTIYSLHMVLCCHNWVGEVLLVILRVGGGWGGDLHVKEFKIRHNNPLFKK